MKDKIMGLEKKGDYRMLSFEIEKIYHDRLKTHCQEKKYSISKLVRYLLKEYLDNQEKI